MKKKPGRPKKVIENGEEKTTQGKVEDEIQGHDERRNDGNDGHDEGQVTQPVPAPIPEPKRFTEKPGASDAQRIAESRESLDQPLGPDQKFFETPDGEIIVGEADKNHIWSRRINNGHGGWVNPMR